MDPIHHHHAWAGAPAANDELGRRERKKLETRSALHRAALQLVSEFGLEVTVDDICRAVDVSSRTFFNYFSSKEEAIVGEAPAVPSDDQLAEFEAGGPTGELLADLHQVIATHLDASLPSLQELHLRRVILDQHPELAARFMGGFVAIERRLVLAAARRLDTSTDALEPQIVGSLATAAMRLSVRRWTHDPDDGPVSAHVHEVFEALRATTR
jgi:AcrR family transcriptional regulator